MGFVWTIVLGFVIGVVAKLLHPGKENMGFIMTVLLGIVSIVQLPIAQFPDIAPPAIQLSTTYVGADAVTVEQAVATPIEQQMSGVDDSIYMYSVNTNAGTMTLYVYFEVGTDPNIDQVLSQMRQSQAESQLPEDVRNYGVTIKKSTSNPLLRAARPMSQAPSWTRCIPFSARSAADGNARPRSVAIGPSVM